MEGLEQLLTCSICLDRYRNPKLLPCQHSLCMQPCLEGIADYERQRVKCPECRAEHHIPDNGIQGFPTNITLQHLLELNIEVPGNPPDPIPVWVPYSPNTNRDTLVYAGNDIDGFPMYIARTYHKGDLLPGKLATGLNSCLVSYDGDEINKQVFEVLIDSNFTWVYASDGNVPNNAVPGGHTSDGETLYIGRASHSGALTPGKVHPSHKCLYLPFGGKEHRYTNYEVLCNR